MFEDRYYGIDISDEGLKIAKEYGLVVKKCDLNKKIQFKGNFFDIIYCAETLEHIYNTDNLISEVHRILKTDGCLIITTPNLASWYNRALLLGGFIHFSQRLVLKTKLLEKEFLKKYLTLKQLGT